METINKPGNSFLMSTNPIPLSFLKYQLIYQFKNNLKYLKSFNILLENKILKKYYLDELVIFNDKLNIEEVISNRIICESEVKKNNYKSTKPNKKKTDSKARSQAACELFSNLGL